MNSSQNITGKLFQIVKQEYGDKYLDHLIEQYKTYLEMADRISSRRQSANLFFLTLNTTTIGLVSYVNFGDNRVTAFYWLISIAGLTLSYMWYRLIRSYRDLNTAKFKVVHEIEAKLPISPYNAEWEAVERGENPKLYLPFTHIEIYIPWVFFAVHSFVFLRCLPWSSILKSLGSK
ncbi:MAG: hypothetical protein ACFFCW_38775 [Candidatus Hodarchaeota archaeon]